MAACRACVEDELAGGKEEESEAEEEGDSPTAAESEGEAGGQGASAAGGGGSRGGEGALGAGPAACGGAARVRAAQAVQRRAAASPVPRWGQPREAEAAAAAAALAAATRMRLAAALDDCAKALRQAGCGGTGDSSWWAQADGAEQRAATVALARWVGAWIVDLKAQVAESAALAALAAARAGASEAVRRLQESVGDATLGADGTAPLSPARHAWRSPGRGGADGGGLEEPQQQH